ncbi:hypothetical protein BDZ94DRAFT_575502 [Collybia nuda]|uniref:DUF6534 domain-containing protein n=1 Tax=Collybia nuda TaxID=64659 RepID=A0A9P6CKK4_9AGAR|nr:hypothetical protein BDZ94DRAFT_575502 [Collybia nuda]
MAPQPRIDLDSKLGAAFLGNLAAAIFYGITCVQAYIYFKSGHKDKIPFKALIAFVWILETTHLALITHALYYYVITNFGNYEAIAAPTPSILVMIYVTCITDLIIRGIFARRVWFVTGHNTYIAASICILALLVAVTGFIFASRAFVVVTFANFSKISAFLYTSLASGVVADTIIAASLCISLSRVRTGFQKTDSVVNALMAYSINTSLLTTVCSALCFITYAIWPEEFTYISIYFSLPKLFFNSLLATLNAREGLKESISGVSEVVLSGVSSSRSGSDFSKEPRSSRISRQTPVVVTINRQVEVGLSEASMYPPKRNTNNLSI